MEWQDAVRLAIGRHCRATKSDIFTRKGLMKSQMDRIIADTGSMGATPDQTLSRILQELRDAGQIEFVEYDGTYRKLF